MLLTGAPVWVWFLLAALVALGVRRLRTRVTPVAVALIPAVAFFAWSLVGAASLAGDAGVRVAAVTWLGGVALGGASVRALPEPRATLLAGGRVSQPGSPLPLLQYLTVFVARFACGAWTAIVPEMAPVAASIGTTIGAIVTGRLLFGLRRWHRAEVAA